jgi:hypothetical protein
MYEEQLYKEVVYDTRENAITEEAYKYMNPLKKANAGSAFTMRNKD